jgi:hypothetical protein
MIGGFYLIGVLGVLGGSIREAQPNELQTRKTSKSAPFAQ